MITAAYQGVEGASSDVLLRRHFGAREEGVETLGLPTFRDVAVALLAGRARYGVLPLENTVAGTFREGYDLVAQYALTPARLAPPRTPRSRPSPPTKPPPATASSSSPPTSPTTRTTSPASSWWRPPRPTSARPRPVPSDAPPSSSPPRTSTASW